MNYHSCGMYVSSNYFRSLTTVICGNQWFTSKIYGYNSFVVIVEHLFTGLRIYCT